MNFVGDAFETGASDSFRLRDRGLSAMWTCSFAHQVSPFIRQSLGSCGKADNTLQSFAHAIWTPWLVSHVFPTPPLAWLCLALLILPKSTGRRRLLNLITWWDRIPQRLCFVFLWKWGAGGGRRSSTSSLLPIWSACFLLCTNFLSAFGVLAYHLRTRCSFLFMPLLLQMWSEFWSLIKLSSLQR